MAFFRRINFIGTIPGIAAHMLPENAAQVAINCRLINGNLAPMRNNLAVNTPAKAGTKLSLYRLGNFWLHWLAQVEAIKGPVAGDTTNRTYFTEGGQLRVTNASMATTGGTHYPMDWYRVGIPAPGTALTATLVGSADDPDDTANIESRAYVYAYVNGWGEEGPWSPASNIIDWNPGQSVTLSAVPAAAPVQYDNIIGVRIYRRLAGEGFKYVMDATFGSTPSDTVPSASLGEAIPSANWYPPPDGMHSIVNHPGSFIVGAVGNEIAPSEAGLPHAYDPFNRQTVPYDIVGLGIVGQGVLILTGAGLWYAAGVTPDSLSVEKVDLDQSCVSRRSIFDITSGAVGFASPDGLFAFGMGAASNLTQSLFTRDQWQALSPSSMLCAYHDGKIFVFYDNGTPGGFIVYPGELPTKIDLDFHASAAFVDKETDTLYLMVGNDVVAFEGGTITKQATWKGRIERVPRHMTPGVARIRASAYPVTLQLYVDGTLKFTRVINSKAPVRLPTGYLGEEFEIACLTSAGEISEIVIAETMKDMRTV